MELFLDVLGESLVDTAKMLPFLFLVVAAVSSIAAASSCVVSVLTLLISRTRQYPWSRC